MEQKHNDDRRQSYRPIEVVMTSASMQMALLKAMKRDFLAFKTRYRAFQDLFEPLSRVIDEIEGRMTGTAAKAPATGDDNRALM
jgi:hypothetical protein